MNIDSLEQRALRSWAKQFQTLPAETPQSSYEKTQEIALPHFLEETKGVNNMSLSSKDWTIPEKSILRYLWKEKIFNANSVALYLTGRSFSEAEKQLEIEKSLM